MSVPTGSNRPEHSRALGCWLKEFGVVPLAYGEGVAERIKAEGNEAAATPEVLTELVALIQKGLLEVTIAATYPLERVRDAFRELERQHTRGKIVLEP